MLQLSGEYECKVDAKGRMMFPSRLRKQLEEVLHFGLMLNRDLFEKCLVLYPKPEWDRVNQEMSRLSRYDREHMEFRRRFINGATLLELDSAGRLLIPAALLNYAEIDLKKSNDLIVSGLGEVIEIWSKQSRENMLSNPSDLNALTSKVRKDIDRGSPGHLMN